MCNWAGRFSLMLLLVMAMMRVTPAQAAEDSRIDSVKWEQFAQEVETQKERDYKNGLSYIISGSLALAGGIWGANITEDNAEKGVYTVFQTIGIASVGYGAYVWKIGGEERSVYQTLQNTRFTNEQKSHFLKSYNTERKDRERRDRLIRALTHGLIAGLNIYTASIQKNDGIKTGLYFIGGVNLLAAISFTFEF